MKGTIVATFEGLESPPVERLPIEQVLGGLKIHALGDGEIPIEAFVLIKVCAPDGSTAWSYRTTTPPNRAELLGALLVHTDLLRRDLLSEWDG
jgi:hypothetical protein